MASKEQDAFKNIDLDNIKVPVIELKNLSTFSINNIGDSPDFAKGKGKSLTEVDVKRYFRDIGAPFAPDGTPLGIGWDEQFALFQ